MACLWEKQSKANKPPEHLTEKSWWDGDYQSPKIWVEWKPIESDGSLIIPILNHWYGIPSWDVQQR